MCITFPPQQELPFIHQKGDWLTATAVDSTSDKLTNLYHAFL